MRGHCWSVFSLLLIAGGALGEDGAPVQIIPRPRQTVERRVSSIRLNVNMVMIPANVTDANDRPVLDLRKEDFRLFEDSIEQKIESVTMDEVPISLGIILDTSGSMRDRIGKSLQAISQGSATISASPTAASTSPWEIAA